MTHPHCSSWNLLTILLVERVANHDSCLSIPPRGSTLIAVVLGIGTQNYTCSSPSATPTPNGALAVLYDISCPVVTSPRAAHHLSALALKTGAPTPSIKRIGNHYFTPDAAVFEFSLNRKSFKFVGTRRENITAPHDAVKGSVDWLILETVTGLESQSWDPKVGKSLFALKATQFLTSIQWMYRVFTAGGKAPDTCKGLQKEHTVNYATEYCE